MIDTADRLALYQPPRRPADRLNVSAANSLFFSEWYDWLQKRIPKRYGGDQDRLLQDWVETIQAKGGSKPLFDLGTGTALLSTARSWLKFLEDESQPETEEIRQFHTACLPACGRRFGITRRGYLCLLPRNANPGDPIFIPQGSKVPFVFREVKEGSEYSNVGECYVHGAMHGDALSWDGVDVMEITVR
ncbi:hypothetical protein OQA88_3162 [Cercophora sp. LCS_1]